MEPKIAQFINKGMQQDYSISKSSNEFAFKNHNIRITTRGDNSLLTVTNEKSNKELPVYILGETVTARFNQNTKTYISLSFTNPKKLSRIRLNCVGTQTINGVEQSIDSILIELNREELDYILFEDYIENYIENNIQIKDILSVETWNPIHTVWYFNRKVAGISSIFVQKENIKGTVIGHIITKDVVVLFTVLSEQSYIYTYNPYADSEDDYLKLLYSGNLGFSLDHPIETLYNYESENVEKVYWVDGINRPRVINIKGEIQKNNDSQFDFNPTTKIPEVEINKEYIGAGNFQAGTIQYLITYYNNFMQESAPVYISPLYYLSNSDRGAEPGTNVSCSFNISISNADYNWDNIRVYSIIRGSDANALGYLVAERPLKFENNDSIITIVDTGTNNEALDATSWLFQNDDFIASTISKKGDQLFLGGIKTPEIETLSEDIKTSIKNACVITWYNKPKNLSIVDSEDLYYYESQLKQSESDIKGFKYGERYRFAIQFQNSRGIWGEPIWLGDFKNENHPTYNTIPAVKVNVSWNTIKNLLGNDVSNARLLRAEIDDSDRSIVAQGILSPTVYNMSEAVNNRCNNINSWIQRFTGLDAHLRNVNFKNEEPEAYYNKEVPLESSIREYDLEESITNSVEYNSNSSNEITRAAISNIKSKIDIIYNSKGYTYLEQGEEGSSITFNFYGNDNNYIIDTLTINNIWFPIWKYATVEGKPKNTDTYKKKVSEAYNYLTDNIRTASLTETALNEILNLIKKDYPSIESFDNLKVGDIYSANVELPFSEDELLSSLVDYANGDDAALESLNTIIDFNLSGIQEDKKQTIETSELRNQYFVDAVTVSMYSPDIDKIVSSDLKFRITGFAELDHNISSYDIFVNKQKGSISDYGFNGDKNKTYLYSHYLWYSKNLYKDAQNKTYGYPWIGLWQQSGSLSNHPEEDILTRKVIGNLWYCNTYYQYNNKNISWGNTTVLNLKKFVEAPLAIGNKVYKGNYNYTLLPVSTDGFMFYYAAQQPPTSIDSIESTAISSEKSSSYNGCNIKFNSASNIVFSLKKDENNKLICLPGYNEEKRGYENKVYSSGEVLQTQNAIKPDREKCYIYPFLFKVDGYLADYKEANVFRLPYIIDLNIEEGQFNSGRTVPSIKDAYVIVGFYGSSDVETYIAGDDQLISDAEKALIEAFKKATKNSIVPYPPNSYNVKYNKIIEILSKNCEYGLYKVINANSKTLECKSQHMEFFTAEAFVEKYKNTYFTGVGGSIGGFDKAAIYTGGNCKISYLKPSSSSNNDFICCQDERIIGNIYSDNIAEGLPSGLHKYLHDNRCILIGEFYRNLTEQYGGTSPAALANTKYVVCSNSHSIEGDDFFTIDDTYGDTYYQRWDCLRTYPTTEEDVNSVVDVVSVMIESYTNLDGRWDNTRGRLDVHNIRPSNINLINKAYTQNNNFFTVYDQDARLKNSNFENCYTWSLKKTNGELIDNWTKGLLVNVNALDGTKGKLTKLQLWKDYLLAFQETGIARIHYNDQTTLGSLEGIPVEIANSNKVQGHNYLSEAVGCHNKWSIVPTESGIYFIDSVNKSINIFNGNVVNLSYNKAFKDWCTNNLNSIVWTPNNLDGYFGSFDFKNRDYYITNKDNCLCFSEELQAFTSFYDYTKSPIMFNFKDMFIGIQNKDNKTLLWKQFAGNEYCNFYGEQKDYYVEYNINPNPLNDKLFTNLEYRAYVDDSDDTFDLIEVSNEYQHGSSNPNIGKYKYPNAERKFRIWRTDIPRAANSRRSLDRIRSPWMKLKLTKSTNTNNKMNFHDLLVKYYE